MTGQLVADLVTEHEPGFDLSTVLPGDRVGPVPGSRDDFLPGSCGRSAVARLTSLPRCWLMIANSRTSSPRTTRGRCFNHATDWPGHWDNVADSIHLLVQAGANVEVRFPSDSPKVAETPLHWAASSGDAAAVEALLDAGATVDVFGGIFGGCTPFAEAIIFENYDAARLLLDHVRRTICPEWRHSVWPTWSTGTSVPTGRLTPRSASCQTKKSRRMLKWFSIEAFSSLAVPATWTSPRCFSTGAPTRSRSVLQIPLHSKWLLRTNMTRSSSGSTRSFRTSDSWSLSPSGLSQGSSAAPSRNRNREVE